MTIPFPEPSARRSSTLLALGYCVLGCIWMIGGRAIGLFQSGGTTDVFTPSLFRGLLFVALSTVALYFMSLRLLRSRNQVEATLKRTTSELVQAQKLEAVGRLAASVAHDFNNILTAISGMAELLREDLPEGSGWRQEADEIVRTSRRATGLTRQLLIFSGSSEPRPATVDLNESIATLMPMLRAMAGPNVELEVSTSAVRPCVYMEPSRVDQVLMNLISNARDAMPEGGRVVVESRVATIGEEGIADQPEVTPGDYAILSVSDTGTGMDATTLSHCFEPFYTTKPRGQGTGLGLATVYGIIHEAGGHLSVYSELGTGTTFKAYMPVQKPTDTSSGDASASESASQRNGKGPAAPATTPSRLRLVRTPAHQDVAVLIVEDEPSVRRVAATALGRAGYRVMTAMNAQEALETAAQNRVDLLFTDMVLPDQSGAELALQLLESQPDMRVLITSGYTELSVRLRPAGFILTEGRAHFIEKPYSVADLSARVEQAISSGNGVV